MSATPRPGVDVVVPFAGSVAELESLLTGLAGVRLGAGDQIVVADNRPPGAAPVPVPDGGVRVVAAPEVRSSYHARNRGAAAGAAEWLLFLDADIEWSGALLDEYFEPPPGPDVAILAGAIDDAPLVPGARSTLAERYAVANRIMAAENTLGGGGERPPYAQTANALVRRSAFESVGGFADDVRSGADADLGFRLLAEGWGLEPRPGAVVLHRNRRTVRALVAQKVRHGAGAAWIERRHPGTFPRRSPASLARWSARELLEALPGRGGRGGLPAALVQVASMWAFELGRHVPNRAARAGR